MFPPFKPKKSFASDSTEFPLDDRQYFYAQMRRLSFLLIALIVIIVLVKPSLVNLNAINYANISSKISALNTPERVRAILHFFVNYNVFLVLCALFGVGVGASEILSRYRDEPFIAISSPPGRRYLAVNAGISLAAFYLLHYFKDSIFPGLKDDPLMMSIVAGFGAMIVMRSKIFNFKTESGESYAIGPDAVLSIFLASVDRQIDRYRASRRQSLVYEETQNVVQPVTAPAFLRAFLVSYQNLSNQERAEIDEEVKKIYGQEDLKSPRLKFMTAAFGFLNIMGESNFKELVVQLKKYQQLPQETPEPSESKPQQQGAAGAGEAQPEAQPAAQTVPVVNAAMIAAAKKLEEEAATSETNASPASPVETEKAKTSPLTNEPGNSKSALPDSADASDSSSALKTNEQTKPAATQPAKSDGVKKDAGET